MSQEHHNPNTHRRRAVSLAEAVISIVIVGVMMVAALRMVGTIAMTRQHRAVASRGPALAQHLLSEVLRAHYAEPTGVTLSSDDGNGGVTDTSPQDPAPAAAFGPETGETNGNRTLFDDVDDYHGWSATPPVARDGTAITGFDGWTRAVSIAWAPVLSSNPGGTDSVSESGLKRIKVTVTDPEGRTTSLLSFRAAVGPADAHTVAQTTQMVWTGVSLQVGTDAKRVASGTQQVNQPSEATN